MQKYQQRIFHLIYRITHDADVVEPLAQEIFLKAYQSVHTFQGNSQFYTWLYRIGVNACLSYLKKEGRRKAQKNSQGFFSSDHGAMPENPEQKFMNKELSNRLLFSMKRLPRALCATLVLREFMELNYDEIAETMQVPLGTVRSRLFRGRALLKEQMRPYL